MSTDRNIIDPTNGEILVDKTPEAIRQLILNMTSNSKQFGTREDFSSKQVNEVCITNIENKVINLTFFVCSLACVNKQQVKVCSICYLQEYA